MPAAQASQQPAHAPSSASAVDELEGLFTTAQPSSQAAQPQLQGPGPQPWQQSMGQPQPGQGMTPGMMMMMMQAGMGMQPGTTQQQSLYIKLCTTTALFVCPP